MAERGGRRVPKNPVSYSGVGARAKRTDQPLRSPNVQDSTELPQGSREQILQAQRVAPLSRTPTPRVQPAPARGNSPLAGGGAGRALPQWLFETESARPLEPETTGLDVGPGAGSEVLQGQVEPDDDKEFVLQMLATGFGGKIEGSQAAADMLRDIQASKAQSMQPQMADPMLMDDLDEEEALAEPTPIDIPMPTEELPPEDPALEPEIPESEPVV